ncbi:MAG TPA: hypothetical protein VE959_39145 [Bryobacteraceae bacterium]|nr:membrane hypothetical protein [Candidatus Sulfopaludibacter sp. SbA4]HYW48946.1 hypothetical protein [Bryobacteraceae bacterium]
MIPRPTPRVVAGVLAPCAVALLLAGTAWSAAIYYSARPLVFADAVLSDLQSPDDNPHGYLPAALATVLCGLLLFPAATLFQTALGQSHRRLAAAGAWLYRAGLAAAVAMGLLEPFQELYSPLHVLLAYAAFVAFVAALGICTAVAASAGLRPHRAVWVVAAALQCLALAMIFEVVRVPWVEGGFWSSLAAGELALCALIAGTTAALAAACRAV